IDIAAAAKAARASGALLAVDGTAAPPTTTKALALGADVVFHSATKYLGGHSDLLGGVLSVRDTGPNSALSDHLAELRGFLGNLMTPFEAFLLVRGLRTLFVRWDRQCQTALTLAQDLSQHPALTKVLYPGLPTHPSHAVAERQMTRGFGGMLSILVAGDAARAQSVAERTEVWIPATSLGGVESLIEHRKAVEGPHSIVPDTLIRLSVGLEDAADLMADLDQALA
ncbi:MAG: PLP-dependent transferase, partial [Pseudomonadota bacterium]